MVDISRETRTALHFEEITAAPTPLDPRPRAIYIAVGGTATLVNENGTSEADVALVAGTIIPCQFAGISSITDAKIYGLYG